MRQEEPMDLWVYEREAFDAGIRLICGVDEAGRGPLAGPVCAAAVILPPGLEIPGLNDSKKLTDKKRRELYDVITAQAVSYGIAFASEQEIDEINILQATFLAMERAIQKLSPQPELALIDGNRAKDFGLPVRTIVKGDSLSASIAAASILAKVTRDRLMEEYDAQYPQYGFAVHKGYGTKRHYEALREFGPSPIHRKTFLKKFYENRDLSGPWGEALAAEYLRKKGWRIEAMNYRTRLGEIDIIASNRQYLVFCEVKLRKSADFAAAREFVDAHKQQRLRTTALLYLSQHETPLQPRFDVIEIYAPDGTQTRRPQITHMEDAF